MKCHDFKRGKQLEGPKGGGNDESLHGEPDEHEFKSGKATLKDWQRLRIRMAKDKDL